MAPPRRELIAKAAKRKLPAKADDGTPYCVTCREYGELNKMVSTGVNNYRQCEAWTSPVYADYDRLTYEELIAGAPCSGCRPQRSRSRCSSS